ncbi:MAG: hypothetical protein FJ313_07185 [Gemmatimonadetes bacterium]|nr:hypothetical protein [Gemmatimonadota bacterium]
MKNSTFLKLLVGALLLGASYGAVFFGGVAFGRTQGEPSASPPAGVSALPTPVGPQSITFTPQDVAEMRAELEARFGGELPEGMQAMLDRFSGGGTIDFEALRQYRQESGAGGMGPGMFGGR